jgi:mono/diheme cytochrome c family protein
MSQLHFARGSALSLIGLALVGMGSCFAEPGPPGAFPSVPDASGGVEADAPVVPACPPARPAVEGATCKPAQSPETLQGRTIVSCADCAVDVEVFTEDLFNRFKGHCGGCHVDNNLGNFQVTAANFSTKVDQKVIDAMRSPDPKKVMPPLDSGGIPWEERPEGDAVREMADLIERWIAADRPADRYIIPASEGGRIGDSVYFMPEALAQGMTNIGNCIPDPGLVATEFDKSCELDVKFRSLTKKEDDCSSKATPAERIGLPERLEETDLFTFDSAELAKHGVIAFAPNYPLWSDGAGKLRHVRVPLGQSIEFNKETREFEIPEKTRFYKTFLRKIKEKDGVERWRKIETRIIVAGKEPLFGTYAWNETETEARLVTDPLRNGAPFTDRVIPVIVDELVDEKIRNRKPPPRNLTIARDDAHVIRRYAIPGSERCVQCHMGSASKSFVLGFTPMQVLRRPVGDGGTYEPTGPDELTQFERLIKYGVITGIESPAEVTLLENSQGTRKPRTPEELKAQAYMFGNCAHCHNPDGFPTERNPELAALLDFWPDADGGIFEFPLERYSPRIKRGENGDVPVPYITPSLRDLLPVVGGSRPVATDTWQPKGDFAPDLPVFIDAPWRSLIYRNVDSAYTYSEDFAIYPHMPFNTPGYDCRARQFLGEWMVSIVAVRKDPKLNENSLRNDSTTGEAVDNTPQPYVEVKPGDVRYPDGVRQTANRLTAFRQGDRYTKCEEPLDIQDVKVLRDSTNLVPVTDRLKVPKQPHWVVSDLTEACGPWNPRRADWAAAVVNGTLPPVTESPAARDTYHAKRKAYEAELEVLKLLQEKKFTDEFKRFATVELPVGLWQSKPGCNLSTVPKVSDYPENDRPTWMRGKSLTEPVYTMRPGAAVFGMICVNCHGRQADSKGIQASTLADMTGGTARVANLRDGLFGPPSEPGTNRARVFGAPEILGGIAPASHERATEEWAARYLAWMGLGGTKIRIPLPILKLVANTAFLGVSRQANLSNISANMLTVAQERCLDTLPAAPRSGRSFPVEGLPRIDLPTIYSKTGLITKNGDAELWEQLCTFDNPSPIRVVHGAVLGDHVNFSIDDSSFYDRELYPSGAPVGNHQGRVVQGVQLDNRFPWCIAKSEHPLVRAKVAELGLPVCPDSLTADKRWKPVSVPSDPARPDEFEDDFRKWSARGAINAGWAVFLYLNDVVVHGYRPKPAFDQCESLVAP